jgi:hypothetical protein
MSSVKDVAAPIGPWEIPFTHLKDSQWKNDAIFI